MSFAPLSRFPAYIAPCVVPGMFIPKDPLLDFIEPDRFSNQSTPLYGRVQKLVESMGIRDDQLDLLGKINQATQPILLEDHVNIAKLGRDFMATLADLHGIRIDCPRSTVVYPSERANYEKAVAYLETQQFVARLKTMDEETLIVELDRAMQLLRPKTSFKRTRELYLCKREMCNTDSLLETLKVENPEVYAIVASHGVSFESYLYCLPFKQIDLAAKPAVCDYFLPCFPAQEVTLKHNAWAMGLLTGLKQNLDAVLVAAWAFTSCLRIAPYANGNESLAFLIMNAILMNAGLMPIVFTSFPAYFSTLAREWSGEEGAFEAFLRAHVISTNMRVCPGGEGLQRLGQALKRPLVVSSVPPL